MIAVIFEVFPKPGKKDRYMEIAADLRADLQQVEGFISVERFQSLMDPKKILSISFFEDEAALARWRNLDTHREGQAEGRQDLFEDYRIRVAQVVRDYGMFERDEVPQDSLDVHSN